MGGDTARDFCYISDLIVTARPPVSFYVRF